MRHTNIDTRTNMDLAKTTKNNGGFTLIEIAVSLMVMGLLIAPAIAAYNLYVEQQKIEHTKISLDRSSTAITAFLESYGRYPCPAPMDADVGDVEYGYEDCSATAPGIITAQSARVPALANPNVLIGSLPFRTLNLDQNDVRDGYYSRLTYAVTEDLTDSTAYAANLGGIGVLSNAGGGDSAISPENAAHFLILSHGKNGYGAIIESGAPAGNCASGSALEQENCDYLTDAPAEAIFQITHKQNNFDDVVSYYMGRGVTPWQYQDGNTDDIHLRRGDTIVSGDTNLMTQDLSALAEKIHVRGVEGNDADGTIRAQGNAGGSPPTDYTGTIRVNNLCGEDASGDGCFSPEILYGGRLADGVTLETITGAMAPAVPSVSNNGDPLNYGASGTTGGMACTNQEIMVGIKDGRPLCSRIAEFNCPTTPTQSFLKGVDSNGEIICDGMAPSGCAEQTNVANSCGGTFTLPEKAHNARHQEHSGMCYEIANFDDAYADTLMIPGNFAASLTNIQNYVDTLNAANRTATACESHSDGLVRDTYICDNGNWNENASGDIIPDESNERGYHISSWTYWRTAEALSHSSYTPYPTPPADPMSVDADNSDGYHDCWCREDYRVQVETCSIGTGQRIRVQKHPCPQTYSDWDNEWISDASLTCACVPQNNLTDNYGSCEAYYSDISASTVPPGSMDGDVDRIYDLTCPGYVEVDHPMNTWDTSSCICPNRADRVPDPNPVDCPAGFTNSFTFEGETYTDVESVEHERWVCPGPNGKGGQVSAASHHGYWDTPTTFTQACTCDASATDSINKDCDDINPQWTGAGVEYQTVISCPSGTFSEPSPPVQLGGECYSCSWEAPSGSPDTASISGSITAIVEGTSCNCNASLPPQPCAVVSGSTWDKYNACTCEANVRQL